MKMGLESILRLLKKLGDPQLSFESFHIAGTNGKGAVAAILDSCLRCDREASLESIAAVGRYTSPHLVNINERFFVGGAPVDDETLETAARAVETVSEGDETFFEVLTATAFKIFADKGVSQAVVECGLGGRLDATNVCRPAVSVITRVGLDHCDWLGDTVAAIAMEKAGIIKPGVPVVVGKNTDEVVEAVETVAKASGSPFFYAPDMTGEEEIPEDFSLEGPFNRENAVTALSVLKVHGVHKRALAGFGRVAWPGRFQRIGRVIVDGAHNPPGAEALAEGIRRIAGGGKVSIVCGFCSDKDVGEVLRILSPLAAKGYAVESSNPRSMPALELSLKMRSAGIDASWCCSLKEALDKAGRENSGLIVVCGSLFLAGDALVELGEADKLRDCPSELLLPR